MIHRLDENTIQKIAAGEVIENPSSVIKELVENSIDAKADFIRVEITKGGKEEIRVFDNGIGILEEDLPLAFERHATSKITSFEDLYSSLSLGFRGEALASIAAVARVEARSKTDKATIGSEIILENSKVMDKKMVAMERGTSIRVKDIFYNLPVRRKFLKSDQAEANRITSLMYCLAIGQPNISFEYIKDSRRVFMSHKNRSFDENLLTLFGFSYHDSLLEMQGESENFKISGRIGNNSFYRGNRKMQFIYVNGRYVEDTAIVERIEKIYRSIIPNGRFPAFQLFIETDPSNIEINIHPNKQKIEFHQQDELLDCIESEVRRLLFQKPQIVKANLPIEEKDDIQTSYQKIIDQYSWKGTDYSWSIDKDKNKEKDEENIEESPESSLNPPLDDDLIELVFEEEGNKQEEEKEDPFRSMDQESLEQLDFEPIDEIEYLTVFFKTYLVFYQANKDAIILMDQHAGHERINYEIFFDRLKKEKKVSQLLLVPKRIALRADQMSLLEKRRDLLEKIGYVFSIFSDTEILLREVPSLFDQAKDEDLFLQILDLSIDYIEDSDLFIEKVAQKACKASVKQGDSLTPSDAIELYKRLLECEYPYSCPHGRPTMLSFKKSDFEKLFARSL